MPQASIPHDPAVRLFGTLSLLLIIWCFGGCSGLAQPLVAPTGDPTRDWNPRDLELTGTVSDLTPEERDVVLHLNLARTNPPAYARTFILPRRGLFHNRIYVDPLDPRGRGLRTLEGVSAAEDAAAELSESAPMPPLAVSGALTRAARRHIAEQSRTGTTGHYGRDGSQPSSRVSAEGAWERVVGEAAAYGPSGGREIVGRLLIDDGVRSRGHRRCILDPRYTVVGVAIGPHPRFGRAVVIDFADAVTEARP